MLLYNHFQLKKKTEEIMEKIEWELEHIQVVMKNEEEDRMQRAKEEDEKRRQKEDQERKFYREFFFTDKEYFGQVDQMYSENYFGDCELNKNSRQVKFISSKERSRRALKKEKQEERESNWITIGTLPY